MEEGRVGTGDGREGWGQVMGEGRVGTGDGRGKGGDR